MKKILITGGSGLLGSNLAIRLSKSYNVLILLNLKKINIPLTISASSSQSLEKIFSSFKPDLVINTVALTNIETCEDYPDLANDINVNFLKLLVKVSKKFSGKIIHISTDHLFDGNTPFVNEKNILYPLNQYAKTKAKAEEFIKNEMPEALILRTNFFGWGPVYRKSFSDKIINSVNNQKKIYLFKDAFFNPISLRNFSNILVKLIDNKANGVFHITANDRVSKFEFGIMLCNYFKLNQKYIIGINVKDKKELANRPLDTSLDNKKIRNLLNYDCGTVLENISHLALDIKDGLKDDIMKL
ncbi:SDR family oxidoreductase [bacterium]|nr:SDR family oxidoreductase [bacterium]